MKLIPSFLIRKLYTRNSLQQQPGGISFHIKNRLKNAKLSQVRNISINRQAIDLDSVYVLDEEQNRIYATDINAGRVLDFPLRKGLVVYIDTNGQSPATKQYQVEISFKSVPFGWLDLSFEDGADARPEKRENTIPRMEQDDYQPQAIEARKAFIREYTGVEIRHMASPSYDPHDAEGNCENFVGVAQVPLGIAGPLQVEGEKDKGSYLIPLATTEGTLVASYNRGIKILNQCGGVRATVQDEAMQRAPCFVMEDAREAVRFRQWLQDNLEEIRQHAESTSSHARLLNIESYLNGKFVFCRFNYHTGDAAGQNMVTLATYTACNWILQSNPRVQKYVLESNMAADKKPSQLNMLHTRGKRVTAEAVLKKEVLEQEFGARPAQLDFFKKIGEMGSFMAGSLNNSLHAANALAALFIATGQDVANIAESCMGIGYSELTPEGDLYVSITLPSLIVASYGGGTGLPAQRECLEMMGCYGNGKARKLAEITAALVLAGEISLGLAVVSLDWVSSHESLGRNR